MAQELPSTDPDALAAMLQRRLVLTRYNGWLYSFSELSETLTIDSEMPPNPRKAQKAAEPPATAASQDAPPVATTNSPDGCAEEGGRKMRPRKSRKLKRQRRRGRKWRRFQSPSASTTRKL